MIRNVSALRNAAAPAGSLCKAELHRVQERLNFITSELHNTFPVYVPAEHAAKI
jgi:hypothetical protein